MIRDMRKYSRQTGFRLIVGFLILVFVVGEGLIYIFYGSDSALVGLICLVAALIPVFLIVGVLALMDWIVKRANQE